MIGRPRTFEIEDALRAAMRAFWANGFEATSVADLVEATGVQKGSLYKAFGDKRTLYLRSLELYLKDVEATLDERLDAVTGGVHGVVESLFVPGLDRCGGGERQGCFAANSQAELGARDPEVASLLSDHRGRVLASIAGALDRAGLSERAGITAEESAQLVFSVMIGLQVQARAGLSAQERAVEAAVLARVLGSGS
ncbi:MAG: TetR/AcrR family transcriptional regulator [Planctomycetota bacterium]